MTKFCALKIAAVVLVFCGASVGGAAAQTLTTLVNFDGSNGSNPEFESLIQGLDGNFYGTTSFNGYTYSGTVFKVTPSGVLTTIYTFCGVGCPAGSSPYGGLVQDANGDMYGTTALGGIINDSICLNSIGCGTVFKIDPSGVLTTLYTFCSKPNCADGGVPIPALLEDTNGNLYGTTETGGKGRYCNNSIHACGTIFRVTPDGTLTTLYSFCSQPGCTDGAAPFGPLVQANDGSMYGTTTAGGLSNAGTIFKISRGGVLTTFHNFSGSEGESPYAGLIQSADNSFYGTTMAGGTYSNCDFGTCGTIFKITARGGYWDESLTGANGSQPAAPLIQASDGNFYGTTQFGGTGTGCADGTLFACGTIFKMTPSGKITTLYNFCADTNCPDGSEPSDGLLQSTDGNFYGLTLAGGSSDVCAGFNCGTIFKFSMGLAPFIKTLPTSGKTASSVFILGNNLSGTTSVTFNGTPATFTVVSATEITTTVPIGATSGTVQVTTPSGTLNSNVAFRVN